MGLRNFSIWRGRLPHWRADDVRYYVTFRHRRPLDGFERDVLLKALSKASGSQWELLVVCVLPEATELMATMGVGKSGRPVELSAVVEPAKRRAAKAIVKRTGERFGPFYEESYDRIVRDDAEFEERWNAICGSPIEAGLADRPEAYPTLWLAG
ncbi:MAG: transposase [Fimbriimonadaceae bacterium]